LSGMSRRDVFVGAGSLWAACLARRTAVAETAGGPRIPAAPVARVEVVKDTYFGETLADPYRWMENDRDPEWLPFLKGQNAHTRAVLGTIAGRDRLLKRIEELSGDAATTRLARRTGGMLFFEQRPVGADNFRLFVRQNGVDRVLIDPTTLTGASGHMSLDWWQPSPNGAHVVYGLSKDGSEDSALHVIGVADGRDLPERIANTEDASPQWLDDGSGFFYNQLTGAVDTPERYLDSQARFHRLGTDPASDPILMKRGLDANVQYERIQLPKVLTFFGAQHAVLPLSDVRTEFRVFIARVADAAGNRARWVPVAGFEDEITDVAIDGGALWLLANQGHPRGRILKTPASAPSLAKATEVVPEGKVVIESLQRAKDGLYLNMMDGGISRLRRLDRAGHMSEIVLPFDGTLRALACEPTEEGALFSFTGWLTAGDIWTADATGKVAPTGLTPKPPIDVSAYEARRSFATARDGTRIPYTLIYRKGLKRDGRTPAWISAYGSYGISAFTPAFAGRTLALIDAGFIVGYANVRGGGEYGRDWHKAGPLTNKPNTWHNPIDVCEELCPAQNTAPTPPATG